MTNAVTVGLLAIGTAFMLLAALGILRMPDVFTRLQTTSKAMTLGVGGILLAVALHFGDLGVAVRALLGIGFVALTAPAAAHMLARAAYYTGIPMWERTTRDELRGRLAADGGSDESG